MLLTVAELAGELAVDPGDVAALVEMYPDDVTDLWSEAGVLSEVAVTDLRDVLDPGGERLEPVPHFAQDRYMCPLCGRRLYWQWVNPATDGWDECYFDGSRWRLDHRSHLVPADEVEAPRIAGYNAPRRRGVRLN